FNLINDAWCALRAGLMPVADFLDLLDRLKEVNSATLFQIMADTVEHLINLLDEADQPAMQDYIRALAAPTLSWLGWQTQEWETTTETRRLRALAVRLVGVVADDTTVKAHANSLYHTWRNDHTALDTELVPAVVHIAAHDGDENRFLEF